MKKLLFLLLGFTPSAFAVGPIIEYVQVTTGAVQSGGFNTQTGTVSSFSVTGLSVNQCVQVGAAGQLTTTGSQCGSGIVGTPSTGTIVPAAQNDVGFYSVTGTSNVISGLSNFTFNGTSVSATGLTVTSVTVNSQLTLLPVTTGYLLFNTGSGVINGNANISYNNTNGIEALVLGGGDDDAGTSQRLYINSGGLLAPINIKSASSNSRGLHVQGVTDAEVFDGKGGSNGEYAFCVNGQGSACSFPWLTNGDSFLYSKNTPIPPTTHGSRLWLRAYQYADNAGGGSPNGPQMMIGAQGVIFNPQQFNSLGTGITASTPTVPLQIGWGTFAPTITASSQSAITDYPGDSYFINVDSTSRVQTFIGVKGGKSVIGTSTNTWNLPTADSAGCWQSDGAGNLTLASCNQFSAFATTSTWTAGQTFVSSITVTSTETVTILNASSGTIKSFMVVGASDASDASVGRLGEAPHITVGSTNFPASTHWGDATSFTVSAGDWDFTAQFDANVNQAATTDVEIGISQTTGDSTTGLVQGDNREAMQVISTGPGTFPMYIVNFRISSASSITAYLKFMATYSSGSPAISGGKLSARRVR